MPIGDIEQWAGALMLTCWALAAGAVLLSRTRFGRVVATGGAPAVATTPPAVAPRVWWWGAGTVLALFLLHAFVVDSVEDPGGLSAADHPVLEWMVAHRTPGADALMNAVSNVGDTVPMAAFAAVGAAVLVRHRRHHEAAVVLVAATGAAGLVLGFKNIYQRPRPPLGTQVTPELDYSLPSGHALGATVVVGILVAVAIVGCRSTARRVAGIAAGAGGIVLVGVSRLYLGVHWFTDVLAGWTLGGAWLAVCVVGLLVARAR